MMKQLPKILTGLMSLFMTSNLYAQHTGKIGQGFNVENYPEVSFIYHSYNPEVLEKENFWHLKEAGNNKEFNIEVLPTVTDTLPQTILILWEDMGHNGEGQFNFTKKVLSGFLESTDIKPSDKFGISAFNRRKNNPTSLISVTDGFTNDKAELKHAVQSYKHSTERYPEFPNRSDMYTAIREGMELLAPMKGTKAIIVFTSGYPMKNSGSDSESQVLLKAQQLHIPVYIFQYYYKSGVAPESEGFAKSTFGAFNSYKDVPIAEAALLTLYPQIRKNYAGHDYKISFTADDQLGSEARMIDLCVNGVEIHEQLVPPAPATNVSWISENRWLVVIFGVIILIITVVIIIFIRKTRQRMAANRRELEDLEQRRIQDKESAEEYKRSIENKELETQKARKMREKQAEMERLKHIMEVKNMFPRLNSPQSLPYEINKPVTTIGREPDNDLVFANTTVSRHHAEIVFNGTGFEIVDKQSTNKVIVNGQFVEERTELKSGDIIGIGEIVITFLY